jgi:hypothetical protein
MNEGDPSFSQLTAVMEDSVFPRFLSSITAYQNFTNVKERCYLTSMMILFLCYRLFGKRKEEFNVNILSNQFQLIIDESLVCLASYLFSPLKLRCLPSIVGYDDNWTTSDILRMQFSNVFQVKDVGSVNSYYCYVWISVSVMKCFLLKSSILSSRSLTNVEGRWKEKVSVCSNLLLFSIIKSQLKEFADNLQVLLYLFEESQQLLSTVHNGPVQLLILLAKEFTAVLGKCLFSFLACLPSLFPEPTVLAIINSSSPVSMSIRNPEFFSFFFDSLRDHYLSSFLPTEGKGITSTSSTATSLVLESAVELFFLYFSKVSAFISLHTHVGTNTPEDDSQSVFDLFAEGKTGCFESNQQVESINYVMLECFYHVLLFEAVVCFHTMKASFLSNEHLLNSFFAFLGKISYRSHLCHCIVSDILTVVMLPKVFVVSYRLKENNNDVSLIFSLLQEEDIFLRHVTKLNVANSSDVILFVKYASAIISAIKQPLDWVRIITAVSFSSSVLPCVIVSCLLLRSFCFIWRNLLSLLVIANEKNSFIR